MTSPGIPKSMRAMVALGRGGNEVLALEERPVPAAGRGEVLVRVSHAAVNPRDWMIRSGRYPLQWLLPRAGLVLGSDLAGEVVATGPGCRRTGVGARVHAMQPGRRFGAFADFAVVPEAAVCPVPETLSDEEASAMTLVGLTAWQGLVNEARVAAGARVLVIGAAGGVGHMAVQVAAALGGRVTGLCSAASAAFVRELGAEEVIDRSAVALEDLAPGWDVIFDAYGRAGFSGCRRLLGPRGTYVGTWPTPAIIAASLLSRVWPFGPRCRLVAVRSAGRDLARLDDLVSAGRLRPRIAARFPLERLADALDASRSFATRGKIVVTLEREDPGSGRKAGPSLT